MIQNHVLAEQPVRFFEMEFNSNGTFEHYWADSAEAAKEYLLNREIDESSYTILIHSPQGVWGKDQNGIFLQSLLPYQETCDEAAFVGEIDGIPSLISIGLASKGLTDNYTVTVRCGNCLKLWLEGIRYKNRTIVRCPQCHCLNIIESD